MAARLCAGSPEAAEDNAGTEPAWPLEDRVPAAENRRTQEQLPRMDPAIRTCPLRAAQESNEAVAGSDCGYPAQQLGAGVQNTPALGASTKFQRTTQHGQGALP